MLKRILLTILTIIFTYGISIAYTPYLPKGSLVKVYTKIPLTTEHLEEGSNVYFIAPSDIWVLENKAIKKGDIFIGYVNMLKMPAQGVNAAMSIQITQLKRQDKIIPIKGTLIFSGNKVLGGTLTNPASYNKTVHPRKVYGNIWGGALQYVPSGEYEFGKHVGINSRDNIFIQIDEDFYI